MAARVYTVEFNAVSVSVQQDFFELTPADDKPIEILGVFISQHSDFGDAQDELLLYQCIRGFTTSGSGGSTATPRPLDRSGPAAGFTCEINNTTKANTGTTNTLHSDSFNVRAGLGLWLPEGCEWGASQADTTIVVRLNSTPADAITANGTLYVRETG